MLRSMMTVSGFTLVSRVLGFLRDILIGFFVGTGPVADAFVAAFRFPNMFRRIFGEGAFNSAFVPLFGRKLEEEGKGPALGFASNAFSTLLFVLGLLTLVAIPCMPFLMSVVVPGFKAKFDRDLSNVGAGAASYVASSGAVGARDIYFQIEAKSPEGTAHWADRISIVGVQFRKRVEDGGLKGFLGRLFGTAPESGEVVPLLPNSFAEGALEGLQLVDGGYRIDPGGLGRIRLPAGHEFAHFKAQIEVEPAVPGEEVRRAQLRLFRNHPSTFPTTVFMARIMFCYLLFMALTAHLSGVLNTFRIFGMPAAAPIILNIVFLTGMGVMWWQGWLPEVVLAWCVAIAGVLQFFALWLTCAVKKAPVKITRPAPTPELKKLFLLMGPGILAAGIQQINLLVGGIIASFQEGAVSNLYYSERVYQLPLGMIGISLGVVLLPEVTRQLRSGHERRAADSIVRGLEFGLLLTIPAAVAMMVIPIPIITTLFERGAFDRESSIQTGYALAGFAVGLPGYVLIKVLQPGYFAREDTKTPMMMAGVAVAVNIAVSLLLFPFFRHVGIAVATSVAAWVNVILLWRGLKGFVKLRSRDWRRIRRIVGSSLVMGGLVWLASRGLGSWFDGGQFLRIGALALLVGIGLAVYSFLVLMTRAATLAELREDLGKG